MINTILDDGNEYILENTKKNKKNLDIFKKFANSRQQFLIDALFPMDIQNLRGAIFVNCRAILMQ